MRKILDNKFRLLLISLIVVGQTVPIFTFGATYWVDGLLYIKMAHYWVGLGNLGAFYNPLMACIAGHFPALPALLWGILFETFGKYTWIVFIVIQRAVMGFALYYFVASLTKYLNKKVLLFSTFILLIQPFFQSFQNMVMTEAFAAASLIFIVASAIFIVSKIETNKNIAIFICAAFIGMQTRPQIALFSVVLAVAVYLLGYRKNTIKIGITFFVVLAAGYLAFPVYRYVDMGKFFLPNLSCISIRSSLFAYVGRQDTVFNLLAKVDHPPDIDLKSVAQENISYEQSVEWLEYLNLKGETDAEAKSVLNNIALDIRTYDWVGIKSQIDSAMSGLGLLYFHPLHYSRQILSEGLTSKEWTKHYMDHFRWISFISNDNYQDRFRDFMSRPESLERYGTDAIRIMEETHDPYIRQHPLFGNLFMVGMFPPDVWFWGLFAATVLFIKQRKHSLLLLASVVATNYFVVLFVGFGNVRYAYIIFPIEVFASGVVVAHIFNHLLLRLTKRKLP